MTTGSAIHSLAEYCLRKGLIAPSEKTWAINTILDILRLDACEPGEAPEGEIDLAAVLDTLLDDAHARGVLAENSIVYRDLFDTRLMGALTPRPAQVIEKFRALYAESPEKATDWYYEFSQDTNYIRRDRIAKDVQWKTATEYGELDITINLSKPEKDPRAIAAARTTRAASSAPRTRATPGGSTTPRARTTASCPSPSTTRPGSCNTPPTSTTTSTASCSTACTRR